MRTMSAIAALLIAAAFCCAEANPAPAQVMKNFSWKKKSVKAKSHDAQAAKAAEAAAGQAPASKRQKAKPGN